jgi:hypothetical protein
MTLIESATVGAAWATGKGDGGSARTAALIPSRLKLARAAAGSRCPQAIAGDGFRPAQLSEGVDEGEFKGRFESPAGGGGAFENSRTVGG